MGLLDGLISSLLGGLNNNQQNGLMSAVSGLVTSSGGIGGLLQRFNGAGLGDLMKGWISNGPNPPATAQHIEQVFSADQLDQVAQQTGLDPSQVPGHIAQILPQLVDKLTPHGQPVEGGALQSGLASLLQGGLGKLFGQH
ncbi:MAG: YidB family protein [Chthoniobacteraceae bacterium]